MADDGYSLGIADYAAIVVVLLISASIGVFFRFSGGRQRTTQEFLMAGRSMSPFPVVFSLIVTFVSAIMMLGIPSEVYKFGLYRMLAYFCSTISNVISAYIFLPVYFEMGDSVSVYEYLERRFGKLTRKIGSVLFILHSIFFMAVVLFAPALALYTVCNISIYASIVSIGGVCTIYCCMGGMKAVLWTDVFQAIVMYVCAFAIFIKGILLAETTIPEALRLIHEQNIEFLSFHPSVRYTLWNCVIYGFLYGLYNYGCNQAQIQRMLSVKNLKLSQRAVIVSVPLAIIFITMNFFLGVIMYANYHNKNVIPDVIERDQVVPHFIKDAFASYPGLVGLCVAGIFSGSLSTVSSSVNSLAAVTMEDFVRPYFAKRRKMTDSTAAILVKVFAFAYGLLGMIGAFIMKGKRIVEAYTILYGIVAGPILGLFTLGMMTIRANEKGALHGLIIGILVTSVLGAIPFIGIGDPPQICTNNTAYPVSDFFNSTTSSTTLPDFIVYIQSANISTDFNNSSMDIFNFTTDSTNEHCKQDERKEWLSIMWLFIIGFLLTTIIGYIASLLKSRSGNQENEKVCNVDPALLSPLVKKWMFKNLSQNTPEYSEELIKLNRCPDS